MTDAAVKEAEERDTSFWSSFSQDDIRLLVVTFAGTVAANVVTAVVVAVAVIAARPSPGYQITSAGVLKTIGLVLLGALITLTGTVAIRWTRKRGWPFARWITVILLVLVAVAAVGTLVFVLVLLGLAVGVK